MRAVCIARHHFLSEHIAAIFRDAGLECEPVVGFQDGQKAARMLCPDVVICDYDLLATAPLDEWERDAELGVVPIIAVSLTRRPDEAHLLDRNGIAGFLYLPTLDGSDAWRMVHAAAGGRSVRAPDHVLRWVDERADRVRRD